MSSRVKFPMRVHGRFLSNLFKGSMVLLSSSLLFADIREQVGILNSGGDFEGAIGESLQVDQIPGGEYNQAPTALESTELFIAENAPIGSPAGKLYALDHNGHKITYELFVDTQQDESKPLVFSVDEDGNLTTLEVFDYEEKTSHEVIARAYDGFGAYTEQKFVVRVLDETIPIVDTLVPKKKGRYEVILGGAVIDPGGWSPITESGILIGESAFLPQDLSGVQKDQINFEDGSWTFNQLYDFRQRLGKSHVWAYAINAEGIGLGLREVFDTEKYNDFPNATKKDSMFGEEAVQDAQNWWTSEWFGYFFRSENSGWILHADLGWLYLSPSTNGLWMWKESLGWLWTKQDIYPFLYSNGSSSWMYFYGGHKQSRLLYDYGIGKWVGLDESKQVERENAR